MKKIIAAILIMMTIIVSIWGFISYCEILIKHNSPNPEYSNKNIIVNITEYANTYYANNK